MPKRKTVVVRARNAPGAARWEKQTNPWIAVPYTIFGAVVGGHWAVENLGWRGTLILVGVLLLLVLATVAVLIWLERRRAMAGLKRQGPPVGASMQELIDAFEEDASGRTD